MKKAVTVFFFSIISMWGIAQCNFDVLIPLSSNYRVTGGDTVGNYARVSFTSESNKGVVLQLDSVYQSFKIPFRFINHSDTPLIITRMNWGEPFFSPNYPTTPIYKDDTTAKGYYTLHKPNYAGNFTKAALVKTSACDFMFIFKGVLVNKKDE